MDRKISKVLARLEKQERAELRKGDSISNLQKIHTITSKIGRFYNVLLKATKAKTVLEIGTSAGYSTIWFAEALQKIPKSKIITIENNPEKIQIAKRNFEESGIADKIETRFGDALDVLEWISHEPKKTKFDFIFIDADKERYIQYFDASLPLLKVGGLICADNITYPKKFNNLMRAYLKHVRSNRKVISVTVPIDNGEEITIKLEP
ncbi:MAG: O-methyltransferase [Thaumarchaeota archaeon]|nr:O-methyltransferase [Nitrososphaerota archaeon]